MLIALREDEVRAGIIPWLERFVERGAAFVLGHERLMRASSNLLRLAQRPFSRGGNLHIPTRFNPAGARKLPALAPRSHVRFGPLPPPVDGPRYPTTHTGSRASTARASP
ncbi:MAG: hypothetical protein ACE5GO_07250 [Anaerolineales bacterium]